jgi:uncharacterized protein YbjT (DUF2867 family)
VKVALYGATGNAGSRILKELAARGHQITAIVRDLAKIRQARSGGARQARRPVRAQEDRRRDQWSGRGHQRLRATA